MLKTPKRTNIYFTVDILTHLILVFKPCNHLIFIEFVKWFFKIFLCRIIFTMLIDLFLLYL